MVVDKVHIETILAQVPDPEIPVLTIQDLGIYQGFHIENDTIVIKIIPTYTGCPAMDMIAVNIKSALQDEGIENVKINLVLDPPWTTDMITEDGKQKMKEYGIAPPVEKSIAALDPDYKPYVACPQCNSENTTLISHFGSTACKSHYKCESCLEPFDHFKCY